MTSNETAEQIGTKNHELIELTVKFILEPSEANLQKALDVLDQTKELLREYARVLAAEEGR